MAVKDEKKRKNDNKNKNPKDSDPDMTKPVRGLPKV